MLSEESGENLGPPLDTRIFSFENELNPAGRSSPRNRQIRHVINLISALAPSISNCGQL